MTNEEEKQVAEVPSRLCVECSAEMLTIEAIASLLEEGAALDDPRPLMLSAVDALRGWCAKCADRTTWGNYHAKAVKPSAFRCSSCGVGCDGTNVHGNLPVCGSCAVAARSSHLRNNFPPRDNALDCDNCGELHDTFESAAICDRAHKS